MPTYASYMLADMLDNDPDEGQIDPNVVFPRNCGA